MELKHGYKYMPGPGCNPDDGTYYNKETENNMVFLLESIRHSQTRIRIYYGDLETGQDWGDYHDTRGRIGRTTGQVKVLILLHNARSTGGGAILTHCIVKITETKGGKVLYQHPKYHE